MIVLINLFVNAPYFETSGIIVATAFGLLWLFGVNRFGLIAGMSLWFRIACFVHGACWRLPHGTAAACTS